MTRKRPKSASREWSGPRPTPEAVQTPSLGFEVPQQNAIVHADPRSSGECRMMGEGSLRGPDFLVIGAQRAGTSWLHLVLRRHRALWVPPVKELHYFDRPEVGRTMTDYKELRRAILSPLFPPRLWHLPYLLGKRSEEWYVGLFRKAQAKGLIAGEITPAYATLGDEGLRRMYSMNSEIKIVFVMRDPVERVWSAVNNALKKNKSMGPLTVENALKMARSNGPTSRSAYTDTIAQLETNFPRRQLYYGFFDDLRDQPERFATGLLSFLGVEPGDVRRLLPPEAVNVAAANKPIPIEFERGMARDYLPLVQELCRRFEGPPHTWLARYEKLIHASE
jgi:Sulfotransferase family